MQRLMLAVAVAWVLVATALTQTAAAATLCVGPGPGCLAQIQPAVDAAHDGDTIRIAPGTYAGGLVINVSVQIVGAGARSTTIKGGGPVILIGAPAPWSSKRPTVGISGVTITGGVNSSFPDLPVTQGGGVQITPSAGNQTGATVTIKDSVITGNQVYAQAQIPPGFCGPLACAFASGGGISSSGVLTLTNTQVTDNVASSPPGVATSASAGGIDAHPQGTLTLRQSAVTGNRVIAGAPNGREAHAGGIGSDGTLTIEDSVVSDNSVEMSGSQPNNAEPAALAGGVHVGDCCGLAGPATITRSIIRNNRVSIDNAGGDADAFGGGILAEAPLDLSDSVLDHNRVSASASSPGATAIPDGGGIEIDSPATIRSTVISFNTVVAAAPFGTALAFGGGIANAGQLTLAKSILVGNSVAATGAQGSAQGGGIWNGTFGGPPTTLTASDNVIILNALSAGPGLALQGGGLYTDFAVTLARTLLVGNKPDQCVGC